MKAEVETLDFDLASNVLNSCNYNRPDDCEITESDILAKLPASVLSDNQVKLCANVLAVRCGFVVKTLDEMRKLLDTDQEYCHDVATYYPTDVDYKDGSMDTADREIVMEMLARYFGTKTWPYVGFQLVIEDYIGLKTMVHNAEQNEAWEINEVVYDTIKKSELKLKKLKNQIEVGLKMYV